MRNRRVALVLGGAICVWRDIEAALALGEYDGVVACNDVMVHWRGHLDAAVTLHPEKFQSWLDARARNGLQPPAKCFVRTGRHAEKTGWIATEYRFPGQRRSGSSGLFAAKVALVDLGFDAAVLCGVPIDPDGSNIARAGHWRDAIPQRGGWNEALPQIKGRLLSMSGWTEEMLGAPCPDDFCPQEDSRGRNAAEAA